MAVLFFFIDGFGIGERSNKNPLYRFGTWRHLFGLKGLTSNTFIKKPGYAIIPTDAHLGVPGTPQSATGQTSLFTGINAQAILNGHLMGFPGEELTHVLMKHSILKQLKDKGYKVTSANAYSQEYFDLVARNQRRVSASTVAIQAAGIPFRMLEDLKAGKALFMDITHHILKARYEDINTISIKQAASNLKLILAEHHFVMYEYFLTDYAGHKGYRRQDHFVFTHLNAFLKRLAKTVDLKKNTIIICSDHGNLEDTRGKGHSENRVPTIVISKNTRILDFFLGRVKGLTDVPKAIVEAFDEKLFQ